MIKKIILAAAICVFTLNAFCQSANENLRVKFLKGNIAEKTLAVKQAENEDKTWLAYKAIDFSLENREFFENDTDLNELVVEAVFSLPEDFSDSKTFENLFTGFSSSNAVQIALLAKAEELGKNLKDSGFTEFLNNYIYENNLAETDGDILKTALAAISKIGNKKSFIILFNIYNSNLYPQLNDSFEPAITELMTDAIDESIAIIHNKNPKQIIQIFKIAEKNSQIPANFMCEIAENTISQAILTVEDVSTLQPELNEILLHSMKILSDSNWTRASDTALSYFQFAKKQYIGGLLPEANLIQIIDYLKNVSPVGSVTPLTVFLEEFNGQTSKGRSTPTELVRSIIKTLGAIGNNSAFDSLLAVTYLSYPESVLSAAREALAELKW